MPKLNSSEAPEVSGKGGMFKRFLMTSLFVVLLVAFVWSLVGYMSLRKQISYLSTPEGQQEMNKEELSKVVSMVAKHIILPSDTEPTLATIQDADALAKEQPFFQGAKNGDKLLIYPEKAILYSPLDDVLVNVGPVYVRNQEGVNAESYQQPTSEKNNALYTIEVRNGSKAAGKAGELATQLNINENFNVIGVGNAVRDDYQGNQLINITGKDISLLATELGLTASASLPEGETTSQADVLVILGN